MSIEKIQQDIDATGAAKAIVELDRDHIAASPDATTTDVRIDADGRVTRSAPAVHAERLAALQQHFVGAEMIHLPFLGIVHGVVDQRGLDRLSDHAATHKMIHAPELSVIRPVATNDAESPPAGPTWGLKRLKAEAIWQRGYTGKNIVVAHLDSGVDSQHPALQGALEQYAMFDPSGNPVPIDGPYSDADDHGTHTAGTLAGRTLNGGPVVGMAPDAELVDARIVGDGDSITRLLAGIDWALGEGARVVNMSVGFPGFHPDFESVIKKLREQHMLPVVAIGNEKAGHTRSPGNYKTVLSVGAINNNDEVAEFSSSSTPGEEATGPMLCAPGVKVLSAKPGGSYRESDGSSMATPHVAGLAALLFSARPKATIDAVEQAIIASCTRPAGADPQRIGGSCARRDDRLLNSDYRRLGPGAE